MAVVAREVAAVKAVGDLAVVAADSVVKKVAEVVVEAAAAAEAQFRTPTVNLESTRDPTPSRSGFRAEAPTVAARSELGQLARRRPRRGPLHPANMVVSNLLLQDFPR